MASPQKENGYTPIANEIMEALIKYPLPGAQMQCVLFILRKTYGYNKKEDAISFSQFEKATDNDRRHINRAINELVKKNVIKIEKGVAKLGNRITTRYCFNKTYKEWRVLPKKVRGIAKTGKKVLPNLVRTKDIQKKVYTPNLERFVDDFISYIKKESPNRLPKGNNIIKNSLDTIDKLIRIDCFDEKYIMDAIRWSKKDDFWCNQIYSLSGLRNKNKDGLMKFQTLSIAFDKAYPDQNKKKIPVFTVDEEDRST